MVYRNTKTNKHEVNRLYRDYWLPLKCLSMLMVMALTIYGWPILHWGLWLLFSCHSQWAIYDAVLQECDFVRAADIIQGSVNVRTGWYHLALSSYCCSIQANVYSLWHSTCPWLTQYSTALSRHRRRVKTQPSSNITIFSVNPYAFLSPVGILKTLLYTVTAHCHCSHV